MGKSTYGQGQLVNKNYANKGIDFEKIINAANQMYIHRGLATVIKVPTPTKVLWKNYNGYRMPAKAFYSEKSWLDYIGVVDGVAVTFDAKETTNKTSFPLSNVKEHQIQAMRQWERCGGSSFLLVWFKKQNEIYLLPYEVLMSAWNEAKKGGRKSIPYQQFKANSIKVNSGNNVYCDWITAYITYRGV